MTERMRNDRVLGAQRAPTMPSGSAPQVPRGRGSTGHFVNQMPALPPNGFPLFFCFFPFFSGFPSPKFAARRSQQGAFAEGKWRGLARGGSFGCRAPLLVCFLTWGTYRLGVNETGTFPEHIKGKKKKKKGTAQGDL